MTGVAEMNGMFKSTYAGKVERAVPQSHLLSKRLSFVPRHQREGLDFNVPVLLTRESGHNFNTDGSAYTLNGAVSDQSQNATVTGVEHVLQVELSYAAMFKALGKGKTAFVNATRHKVRAALESSSFVRELGLMYGSGSAFINEADNPQGLGEIDSGYGGGSGTDVDNITISAKSWCLAIWAGMEGASLDLYDAAGSKQNGANTITLDSVDPDNRQIDVTCSGSVTFAAGDYFVFAGAYGNEMNGAFKVANNAGAAATTLNGINAATYQLWQGSVHNVGGALTFGELLDGLRRPAALGFSGAMDVYVPTNAWQDLNMDQAGQIRFTNKNGGKFAQGAESLCYYGQTGVVNVIPHVFMKQGYALGIPRGKDLAYRVGATDITFNMPDGKGEFFRQLDSKAGIELRTYQLQSYFTPTPAFTVMYEGISSTGDV